MIKKNFLILLFSALPTLSFIAYPVYGRSAETHPMFPDSKSQQVNFHGDSDEYRGYGGYGYNGPRDYGYPIAYGYGGYRDYGYSSPRDYGYGYGYRG